LGRSPVLAGFNNAKASPLHWQDIYCNMRFWIYIGQNDHNLVGDLELEE
jgi:hypothetical protein